MTLAARVKGHITSDNLLIVKAGDVIEGNISATIIIVTDLPVAPERPVGWLTQGEAVIAPGPARLLAPCLTPEPVAAAPATA